VGGFRRSRSGEERSSVESPISSLASTQLKGVQEDDRRELRVRFEVPSDADDPDDSSKERLGDRWILTAADKDGEHLVAQG
jgi:hypothetical protein